MWTRNLDRANIQVALRKRKVPECTGGGCTLDQTTTNMNFLLNVELPCSGIAFISISRPLGS